LCSRKKPERAAWITKQKTQWSTSMHKLIARFIKDETGVTAIEYGLIAALVAVVIISGVTEVGSNLSASFSNVAGHL
jgi:pilus assembly protein Flp/PilA